ncbi:metalloregulator ArsR/SmtB family transcription factor [Jeotgalibacillus soli]|uniref:ArsR family transcriptional regulator n=1 Tax=Jeotgalibacillus soli TaxID=889306 RepID=A0A0C2RVS4_9BACL|nr:metalloregulator ArsR/SmtB family transcription factor [Jeotgalibacillus soli]KIL45864.1 ArsR family transcriptional regulator [Jeotgalibacillus soli]
MQLDKQMLFFKALGDPTRMKILHLLSSGPLHGQAVAERLGLTSPTISHHLSKLRESGAIIARREKNTIYFTLNDKAIRQNVSGLLTMLEKKKEEKQSMEEKEKIIKNFFDQEGRLKTIPAQRKKKLYVLAFLASQLEIGKKYTEKEINLIIQRYHEDFATIRREFINHQFMFRNEGIYELNPPEMWLGINE